VKIVVNNFTFPNIVVNNFTYYPYIVVNKREELMLLEAAMSD